MKQYFARHAGRILGLGAAALILTASVAFAGCRLPGGTTPGSCSYSGTGAAGLTIVDTATTGTYAAILGVSSGSNGYGIEGHATKPGGIGGSFISSAGATSNADNAAISALNNGGTTSVADYGSAGLFSITNGYNNAASLYAVSRGPGEAGYFLIESQFGADNSTARGNVPLAGNPNSASLMAINKNSGGGNCTMTNVPCWGQAGYFAIGNANNQSDAVFAQTQTPHGTAVHGYVGPQFNPGFFEWVSALAVYGEDLTTKVAKGQIYHGAAVLGASGNGYSAYFNGGGSGGGVCYFDGGATWSCVNPADAMDDKHAPNYAELLDRLDGMPMYYFGIKGAGHLSRNLGTSAEEFRAAFDLGDENPKTISDGNGYGVAMAAAKALSQKLKTDEAEIAALKRQLAEQQIATADRIGRLEAAVAHLAPSQPRLKEARLAPAR
jgi:hypothetical protein